MSLLVVSVRLAVRALNRNKLRTALTMLGMIIGVGAVVTMVALGNGAQNSVERDVRSAGTNLIVVKAGNYTRGGEESNIATGLGSATTLVVGDAEAIRSQITGIKASAPGVGLRGWIAAGPRRVYIQMLGTDAPYPEFYQWSFVRGRFFAPGDVTARTRVAVLGRVVAERLFDDGAGGVGRDVTIRGQVFRVSGVIDPSDPDQAEMAYVPFTALQDALAISYLHSITVEAEQAGDATRIAGEIRTLLRERHAGHIGAAVERLKKAGVTGNQMPQTGDGGGPDDFTVKTQASEALTKGLYTSVAAFILANMPKLDEVNMQEMASTLQRAGATMTALLAGIAAISLVVGGIGIMNIMLVSVTERTREIGVRRAVGARRRDVLLQFLVEAVTLSLTGGVIGIIAGYIASDVVTRLLEWPTRVPPSAVGLAFGIAAAVGMLFGFYPARRASRLDPIDALRYE
jgi:ABC-type antimicrobial peptide transport system permease subunit